MKQQTSAASETPVKDRMISDSYRIDFTGRTIYIGIDIHQKDYQVAKVIDGICLGNHRMAANGDLLLKHLHNCYRGRNLNVYMRAVPGVLICSAS